MWEEVGCTPLHCVGVGGGLRPAGLEAGGWRLGLLGPSGKLRRQVQGQAGSVGRMPAGGFPETGHSNWERFPGHPAPPGPEALSADGQGIQAMPKTSQAPACTCLNKSHWWTCAHTPVCMCELCSPQASVHACANTQACTCALHVSHMTQAITLRLHRTENFVCIAHCCL